MKYQSTMGGVSGLTFKQALYTGFAVDGGMLLPESIPALSPETLRAWAGLPYKELVKNIVALYVEDEIPEQDLNSLIESAFKQFRHPEVIGLQRLSDGLNILELFHGKTYSFKDYAMSCVSQFLNYFLAKDKEHMTAIVATSGDTGSAAIESVINLSNVDIIVLTPMGRVSKIQELQMTTAIADNVHVFRVDGTSDDLDLPMKKCCSDEDFVNKHKICSMNSVNWARIMVQIAHYFYAFYQMSPDCEQVVEIVAPSGGGGNITGGVIAQMMGLPVKLSSSVNMNLSLAKVIEEGQVVAGDVFKSLAPAMDIQIPYNLERVLYLLSGRDSALMREIYSRLTQTGKLILPPQLHQKVKDRFGSFVATDDVIKATIRRCWENEHYLLCPHTATAAAYHYHKTASDVNSIPRICLATASPVKFDEAVTASGLTPQPTEFVNDLLAKPTRYVDVQKDEDWEAILREKITKISERWQKSL